MCVVVVVVVCPRYFHTKGDSHFQIWTDFRWLKFGCAVRYWQWNIQTEIIFNVAHWNCLRPSYTKRAFNLLFLLINYNLNDHVCSLVRSLIRSLAWFVVHESPRMTFFVVVVFGFVCLSVVFCVIFLLLFLSVKMATDFHHDGTKHQDHLLVYFSYFGMTNRFAIVKIMNILSLSECITVIVYKF